LYLLHRVISGASRDAIVNPDDSVALNAALRPEIRRGKVVAVK
jgi:hypothetical protein